MKTEQEYIDLFTHNESLIAQHSSTLMNTHRPEAFASFKRLGFPPARSEDYSCTDVVKAFSPNFGLNINQINIPVNPYNVFRCNVPHLSSALYFTINDSFYSQQQPEEELPPGVFIGSLREFTDKHPDIAKRYYGQNALSGHNGIIALNSMFAQDGFAVYIPKGTVVDLPIQLIHINRSDVDTMSNRRTLVIMEERSEVKLLVCTHSVDPVRFLSNEVVEIFAGEGAHLDYYDLEESSENTTRFTSLYATQEASSNVSMNSITLNNGLSRNNYHVSLNGEYAESNLGGLSILDGRQQVDTFARVTHAAPRCNSNELFKNVLNGRSTAVFQGKVLVKEGAFKTSASQVNRNLCSTREARVYGKPQLEIYADDVKCSHGMTTGQLDENVLFYLQSRGIPRSEARTLLSIAFTADVLDNIRIDGLKDRLYTLIQKRFRGELVHCAGCGAN
ncbi:MAG: Fe-S cluster assembly protein SufD [Tannerellaceae bacterium]|jgi:Fe-S cluster assembly protein SufD|nr:Fe-S cluster assembly protein SufD [Tannerellaceae bacterium]